MLPVCCSARRLPEPLPPACWLQEGSAVAERVLDISELLRGLPADLVFVDDGSDEDYDE
jgi:hypothetical protein